MSSVCAAALVRAHEPPAGSDGDPGRRSLDAAPPSRARVHTKVGSMPSKAGSNRKRRSP